jgi:hypothetical protein
MCIDGTYVPPFAADVVRNRGGVATSQAFNRIGIFRAAQWPIQDFVMVAKFLA